MRRLAAVALLAALASMIPSCSPTPAAAEVRIGDPLLSVVAVGDSAKAVGGFTVTSGTADSLAVIFTLRGMPNPVRTVVRAPITGQRQVVTVFLVPSPAYAEGDTGTVTGCPVAYRKGTAYAGTCARPAIYTRPTIAPTSSGDSIITSMRLLPDTATAVLGDTVGYLVVTTYKSGRQTTALGNWYTNGEAGVITLTATLVDKFGPVHAAATLRVKAGANEPAGFTPFAIYDGSEMPGFPRAPLQATPCKGLPTDASWCGRWL